jgi:hypothetical protein
MQIRYIPSLLLACVASSCGGADNTSVALDASDQASESGAGCPADTPEFVAEPTRGLLAVGQKALVQARVVAASVVPPMRYENTWTIELTDAQGAPLAGAKIADACAYMPVHGHGERARRVTGLAEPGRFQLEDLNLKMAGPWEVQLAVTSPGLTGTAELSTNCDRQAAHPGIDYVVLNVCVRDE